MERRINTAAWFSAHLFYSNNWNQLLSTTILEFIDSCKNKYAIKSFFFIRYFERGPHIRLRFLIESSKEEFCTELLTYFNTFFEKHPSPQPSGKYQNQIQNNTIHLIDYCPEIERYGGQFGMAISERQFLYSSVAVLAILKTSLDDSYSKLLGKAIILHITFAFSMNLKNERDISTLFKHIFDCWKEFNIYKINDAEQSYNEKRASLHQKFEERYKNRSAILKPFCLKLLDDLIDLTKFSESWLNDWIEGSGSIYQSLKEVDKQKQLTFTDTAISNVPIVNGIDVSIFILSESYIHMTNNRLGLWNEDESFIAYIIFRCFQDSNGTRL